MHNHGPVDEKPKNLSFAVKKLIKYLNKFIPLIVVALILAALSSIFSIIGPNKLSNLTDTISSGLVLNRDNFTELTKSITSNLSEETLKESSQKIINLELNNNTIKEINMSNKISEEDKKNFNTFISDTDKSTIMTRILTLSDDVLNIILPESSVNNVVISTNDKKEFIKVSIDMMNKDMSSINNIPKSISKVLLPSIKYKNKNINSYDQVQFLKCINGLDKSANVNKIYSAIDKMPNVIKGFLEPKMDFKKIKSITMFLVILFLVSALFNFLQSFIMATVSNNFAKELRTKISVKINKLPLKYFDRNSFGDVLSRVTNDVDTIGMSMYQSLGSLIGAIALFIGTIIMMFVTNWVMAITAIVSSMIGFIFMILILSKSQKYFTARQVELGKLNGHIEEIYSSHNVVKVYNGEKEALNKFNKYNESVYECNKMSQFLSGLMPPLMGFIGNLGYVAVCVVGALLVMNNSITFGVIVAFMIYIRLFSSPLSQIAQGMTSLQSTAAASERVFEFIEEEEMSKETVTHILNNKDAKGNIEFSHVKFGYDEEKTIIKDFSCKVKSGQKIAIVGPTGAGKTTMVNLLMKFYDIKSGDIKIDGISINELSRDNIHKLFVMVLQDTWLFNGTIRDNIKYNNDNITDEEIMGACEIVGVDHFVKSLPGVLDYKINDNESISAGQKQLLTIARGMIEDAPFLILDEATSSVDTRTEELVQSAMDKLTEGKTSFIIAHRLSTIKNANLILFMNEGNIIEQGSHKDLMKLNGFYAELYNSQFKKNI